MAVKTRTEDCITPFQMNLILNARIFWRVLAIWTRTYLRSAYLEIGNVEEDFERLYNVPTKFASTLQLIFGSKFSEGYTSLLEQHISILQELTSAHKEGNIDAVNQNVDRLYQNSYEIAKFLTEYNPFWNETEWKNLMGIYIQHTLEEANAIAIDDHSKSIEEYEHIIAHCNRMGDYFSQGLFNYIVYYSHDNILQNQRLKVYENRFSNRCITYDQMNAIYNIRMFWFELTIWTRALLVVIFENVGYPENILARMNVIINDYQNVLSPFLGEKATEEYIRLINDYIELLVAFVKAQKEGNIEALNQYTQLIYQNLDQRADFLASINPTFNRDLWKDTLTNYTRYTFDESTSYLTGDQSVSLDNFSKLLDLSLDLGDKFAYEFSRYITNTK